MRREYLDQIFFWNVLDLERKLGEFKTYFNDQRTHAALDGTTPAVISGGEATSVVNLDSFRWKKHCGGLFQLPVAA